jgi:hypothetical protein
MNKSTFGVLAVEADWERFEAWNAAGSLKEVVVEEEPVKASPTAALVFSMAGF